MNTLRYYASQSSTSFNPLQQATHIRAHNLNPTGVCYGLSIVYLAFDRDGTSFGAERGSGAMWTYVNKLQQDLNSNDNTMGMMGMMGMVPGRVESALNIVSFKVQGLSHSNAPFAQAAGFVAQTPGHYLFLLGNHCCAAVHRGDGSFKFFDPNYGQAIFASGNKFSACVIRFLSDLKIMENYAMSEGTHLIVIRVG